MAKLAICKATIKKNTIRDMKKLGTFKPEYDRVIDVYSELCEEYARLSNEYIKGGYKFQVSTMQGGAKKAPIVATLETLRKDILAYSDRLCLNPKALETITIESEKKSKLADALSKLE